MKVVVLDNAEHFIAFIDPDMVDIVETTSVNGLPAIDVEYNIEDLLDAKKYFKIGNKLWIHGEGEITDRLYVINTKVKQNLFKDNTFSFVAEDVLVELNYAPLFKQTDLTKKNNFTITKTQNGEKSVTINWNALNYWFGNHFNIGVVQDCLNDYVSKVPLTGTMTLMSLLRKIEEETSNYFITRYEKDLHSNVIHRYLDFLNPHSQNKNWKLRVEYDFVQYDNTSVCYDSNGNVVAEDDDPNDDDVTFKDDIEYTNINPSDVTFRITHEGKNKQNISWNSSAIGFSSSMNQVVFSLKYRNGKISLKAFAKQFSEGDGVGERNIGYIADDSVDGVSVDLLDNSYFEIYDHVQDRILFSTKINCILSDVHTEILDLAYNVENIEFEVDETDTYSCASPVFSLNNTGGDSDQLSSNDLEKIIKNWLNLKVNKGDIIPMIVEKATITGTDEVPCISRKGQHAQNQTTAAEILGTYNVSSNYWAKPIKPNDNTEGANNSYEYWRATAYWKAPFTKNAGEMHISLDSNLDVQYSQIYRRPDIRDSRAPVSVFDKNGVTETSAEDVYAIYNQVAMYLKDHKNPVIDCTVDVANLRDGMYNAYNIHDKVYVRLPGQEELIMAQVIETSKNAHNMAENKVKLGNYSFNTKVAPKSTYIESENLKFKYPAKRKLIATLKNAEYDSGDASSVEVLKNQLLTFKLFKLDESGSFQFTGKVYTKKTKSNGQASVKLKLDPGIYQVEIYYPGDAEYDESSITVEVYVKGRIKFLSLKETWKIMREASGTTKQVETYWTKCGLSPDKEHKEIIAVAKPSAGDGNYSYTWWKTVFKNYCPECHKHGTLRWDSGHANLKCITCGGYHGSKQSWGNIAAETEISCNSCCSDFDAVTGAEKDGSIATRLTRLKKPVRSNVQEKNKLAKGKLVYGTKTVNVPGKNSKSAKSYNNHVAGIPKSVKQKAIQLADGGNGVKALKRVAAFMGESIHYGNYCDFSHSSSNVLSNRRGNCCDQTRLMLQMMDVVDSQNQFDFYYVYVCCNGRVGHVFAKVVTKSSGKSRYVDPCKQAPWGNYVRGWGSPPGSQYKVTSNNLLHGIW